MKRFWLLLIIAACAAIILLGIFNRSQNSVPPANSIAAKKPSPLAKVRPQFPVPHFQDASGPNRSAEKIVAEKLQKFGQNRRDLTHALAKHLNVPVPNDVERFFDAVQKGNREEIDAAHKAMLRNEKELNFPRPELHQFWRPIQEAWGV